MSLLRILLLLVGAVAAMATPARAKDVAWSDNFTTRLEATALVETMNAEFLATRSATLTLEAWCGAHHLSGAAPAKITAKLIRGADKPATPEQRQHLGVGPDEPIKYRHVLLTCGDKVLSEADNWYVPSRLTPEMNTALETTDTPFGKAVLALKFYRQNFEAKVLWWPLPEGWETQKLPASKGGVLAIPATLFEHHAVLYTGDRTPFSEVHEVYQRAMLDFPLPRR
jgi:chorismate-pyruvate lyase